MTKKSLKMAFVLLFVFIIIFSVNSVSAQENKKILFDETHPDGKINAIHSIGTYGSSGFANILQNNGYSVSTYTDTPITPDKLKGYDVLIIMGQLRNYTDDEVQTINNFVNNGGGLLLIGVPWGQAQGDSNFAYNKIAESFGVSFAYNQEIVSDQNYFIFPWNVEITDFRSSPITSNVQKYYHFSGTYIKDPGSSTVVAYTDSHAWGDIGHINAEGLTDSNYKKDPDETSGPFPLISQMDYGKGKVVFMGSSMSLINSIFYQSDVWKMGLNSVNWLANNPVPTSYTAESIIPLNLIIPQILLMIIFSGIVISGLTFRFRKDRKLEESRTIKTIKNWKFTGLIASNAIFLFIAAFMFIPINFYLFDFYNYYTYEPNLGYTLIIVGAIFIFFMIVLLFNLIARQRMLINYSFINLALIIIFTGFTVILGDIYGFPYMQLFTLGGLVLIIPLVTNWWIYRGYGQDIVIEGKEFNRLKKVSSKSLPFELLPFYTDASYIGEGGFGRVFKATNMNGNEVAIKIPKSFDKRAERSFITEVSNWSQLDHPHIVKLYEYKILPIPYIETEFCDGGLEMGMKTLNEAVSIVYEVAKGLEYAHHRNIIHGDVKISNILIKNGVYKISDWGLSKLKIDESVTLSGATPSYCAPEQISSEFGKADERTDIYQLGNVFYELLTGRLPFKGELSQIYSFILTTQPVNPVEINPNSKPVKDIIMKCLAKNKKDRYASMSELIKELEKFRSPDETIRFENH
ncbi:MAG: DUF4350 domain-containing protein [Methanobacterium sp.]